VGKSDRWQSDYLMGEAGSPNARCGAVFTKGRWRRERRVVEGYQSKDGSMRANDGTRCPMARSYSWSGNWAPYDQKK
jgi:hypothetical protein